MTSDQGFTENATYQRLVSPHAFDGRGPVPAEVTKAARRIADLRVKFLKWIGTGAPLAEPEIDDLFEAAAVQAEWMRELYEAVHGSDES